MREHISTLVEHDFLEGYPLWEHFEGGHGFQEEHCWRRIAEFRTDEPLILFFEPEDETSMVELPDVQAVVRVLAETYWDEIYVTNAETSYLLCVNDHDVLIGCGGAAEWVYGLRTE